MAQLEILKCINQISSEGQRQNAIQGKDGREEEGSPHYQQGNASCKGGSQLGSSQRVKSGRHGWSIQPNILQGRGLRCPATMAPGRGSQLGAHCCPIAILLLPIVSAAPVFCTTWPCPQLLVTAPLYQVGPLVPEQPALRLSGSLHTEQPGSPGIRRFSLRNLNLEVRDHCHRSRSCSRTVMRLGRRDG